MAVSGLSAVVIAQDEERTIGRCIESVSFAQEIVVVDGGSRDRTREIAASRGARVVESPWPGFAAQRARALEEARGPWILSLDADEEASGDLCAEIERTLSAGPGCDGYLIPRRNRFLGRWVRHGAWARDVQFRLFRKATADVHRSPVHEAYFVRGKVGRLRASILHDAHPTLADSFARMNGYTSLEAGVRSSRGRVRRRHVLVKPLAVFLKYAVILGGWRDGARGLLLAATTGVYKGVLICKAWERQNRGRVFPDRGRGVS